MKTLSVKPVFVKIDTKNSLISDRNVLTFSDGKIYNPFKNEYYQLILISLDPDERIEEGDTCYLNYVHKHEPDKNTIKIFTGQITNSLYHFTDGSSYFPTTINKIIATQDQLSPEHIQQLVAEYNNGGMQDFEIEMHNNLNDPERLCDFEEPYMPNGFVVVVDKHVFGVSDNPNINGVDYENTPVPDYPIGKPLDDYINAKHSQDRCMGFIDGYTARKLEESISYTEEEVYKLFKKSCERLTNSFISSDIEWFNENKKK